MSNFRNKPKDRLRQLERDLRSHPERDPKVWADEISEVLREMENTDNLNTTLRSLSVAKLIWDVLEELKKSKD